MRYSRTSLVVAWLVSGTLAGLLLDLYLAVALGIMDHLSPITLEQWFASNVVGSRAFSGGIQAAALGLALHLGVSLAWAAIFVIAAARLVTVRRSVVPAAVAFGSVVFIVMQFIVMPLDSSPKSPLSLNGLAVGAVGIIFAFALPLAAISSRLLLPRRRL